MYPLVYPCDWIPFPGPSQLGLAHSSTTAVAWRKPFLMMKKFFFVPLMSSDISEIRHLRNIMKLLF